MFPLQYADVLWIKSLRCVRVCNEYVLKGPFAEGLMSSNRPTMGGFYSNKKHPVQHNLLYDANSLDKAAEPRSRSG